VVIDLGLGSIDSRPEIFQKAFEGLKTGILGGVRGISNSGQIIRQFGYRGAFLRMPGYETMELNKLSRIMYDNPDYLVSKDMAALYRIFDKDPESSYGPQGLMQNLGNYILKALQRVNHKAHNDLNYFGADSRLGYAMKAKPVSINAVPQLVDYVFEQWTQEWHEEYTADTPPFTKEDIRESVQKGLYDLGQTFGDEGEWLIKDGQLRIPPSSTLVVSVDLADTDVIKRWESQPQQVQEMKERGGPLYKEYQRVLSRRVKMDELKALPFKVNFLDSGSFNKSIEKMMSNRYGK
jgi:hypothetical protein